jgi:hypothetical protein
VTAGLCSHFETGFDAPPPLDVCEECIKLGDEWVHLRQCLNCGQTLCCDNSPNRHMTAHYNATGHPMMQTAQPDEEWRWCYPDELFFIRGDDGWEAAE